MELRHLRYFSVTAKEENFHRAAARLGVSQPALSRQIRDLEQEIGIQLFDRLPRGVRLSTEGRWFLDSVDRVLGDADGLKAHAQHLGRGTTGSLRIGFSEIVPQLHVVSESLREFRTAHPSINLTLTPMPSEQQIARLRENTLDAGFVFVRPGGDELEHLEVGEQGYVLGMPRFHPLAKKAVIRLADLTRENFLWTPRTVSPLIQDQLMAVCLAGGLSPNIIQEVDGEDTQLSLVAVGLAVALLVSSITERVRRDNVVFKPVTDLRMKLHLDLAWRHADRSPVLQHFRATVARNVRGR